ncbi:DUF3784 domain-containing protein [Oscillospiraceae bacterium CM]|nr:DUF3784 domain-containing protein [Oscillospiraceae bacterium CM]
MILFWVVIGVTFISSVLLFFGKGSWLIAGYNTASPAEKAKYNQKSCPGPLVSSYSLLIWRRFF